MHLEKTKLSEDMEPYSSEEIEERVLDAIFGDF